MYEVVDARTECKVSHIVSSISSFVAPRGSTSSNFFKMLSVSISISGLLGSHRWYQVGSADYTASTLALVGFVCLLLVPIFDFDVLPQRFLEEKLLTTKWLLDKILKKRGEKRPFRFGRSELLKFLRASPLLYWLYEENHVPAQFEAGNSTEIMSSGTPRSRSRNGKSNSRSTGDGNGSSSSMRKRKTVLTGSRTRSRSRSSRTKKADAAVSGEQQQQEVNTTSQLTATDTANFGKTKRNYWGQMYGLFHMIGAIGFVVCVTAAVILQEPDESHLVAPLAAGSFSLFCLLGYLTGQYIPLVYSLRGYILPWNPFLTEPHFLYKLSVSLDEYVDSGCHHQEEREYAHSLDLSGRRVDIAIVSKAASAADEALDNISLRFARNQPSKYIQCMGYLLVMSELIALLTPCIAIGLQWICALCKDPPLLVMAELFGLAFRCICTLGRQCELEPHCVVRPH